MTEKSFLALLLVTAAAVGAAVFVASGTGNAGIAPDHGKALLPGLLDKANVLAEVSVDQGKEKMKIHKAGGRFVDASGYPVKIVAVRDLVTSLGRMTIEEDKTSDPKRYAELTLAPPGDAKGGTAVALKTADGKALADIVLGARDYTLGAAEGGQYVRSPGARQSYLVRGNATLPETRLGWFDPVLASIPIGEVARLTLNVPGKPAISLARQNGKLALVDLAADRKPDDDKIDQLAEFFSPLSFADVRKADAAPVGGTVLAVETAKGLKLTLDEIPQQDPAQAGWVTIAVQPTDKSAAPAAESLNNKFAGFAFRLAPASLTRLAWSLDDVAPAAKRETVKPGATKPDPAAAKPAPAAAPSPAAPSPAAPSPAGAQ